MDVLLDMLEANNAIMTGSLVREEPAPAVLALTAGSPLSANSFASFSRYSTRVRRRYADLLLFLPAGAPMLQTLQICYDELQKKYDIAASLRITRALAMERLTVLDCDQSAPLSLVTACMTELAEWSLDVALRCCQAQLQASHGQPQSSDRQRSNLWIVGMGKLGARELNVSSDI